jgi:hypothetical protein
MKFNILFIHILIPFKKKKNSRKYPDKYERSEYIVRIFNFRRKTSEASKAKVNPINESFCHSINPVQLRFACFQAESNVVFFGMFGFASHILKTLLNFFLYFLKLNKIKYIKINSEDIAPLSKGEQ